MRQQAEDDSGGGPRPHADLDPRVSRRQRPQELEVDVAAAVEGELRSHLSIRKKNKRNPRSINLPAAGGNQPGYHSWGRAVLEGKKKHSSCEAGLSKPGSSGALRRRGISLIVPFGLFTLRGLKSPNSTQVLLYFIGFREKKKKERA